MTIDDWEVTLNSFDFRNRVSDGRWYFTPQDGNTFLYASFTVENLGNVPRVFNPRVARRNDIVTSISYGDVMFAEISLAGYDAALLGRTISPLVSSTGSIVYTVAERVAQSDEPLTLVLFSESQAQFRQFNVRP